MINPIISITKQPTFAILLRLVNFFFDIVLRALFCAAIRRDSVSLSRFPFLSHVQVFLVGNFASLLLEIWLLTVSLTAVIYLSLLF